MIEVRVGGQPLFDLNDDAESFERYRSLQTRICTWVSETFGDAGPNASVAARANKEMSELLSKLCFDNHDPGAAEECADVAIVLFRLANRLGVDLLTEVERKFEINQNRDWTTRRPEPGDYVSEHPLYLKRTTRPQEWVV